MHISKMSFFRLFLLSVLVSFIAQFVHETGHMLIYQIYHRDPTWGFIGLVQIWNTARPDSNHWVQITAPDGSTGWLRLGSPPNGRLEKLLEALAGPLASLFSTIAGLWIAYKNRNAMRQQTGLMLALVTSFTMTTYYLRSPFRMIGDEFDVALQLGISKGFVEATFGVSFLLCLVLGFRRVGSRQNCLKWSAVVILGSISIGIILNVTDQWIRFFTAQGSPFLRSFLGYSLPVFLAYLLAIIGILLWESETPSQTDSP